MKNQSKKDNDAITLISWNILKQYQDSYLPSQNTARYWLHAVNANSKTFKSTEQTGKWCIFCNKSSIDSTWNIIKQAVDDGKLLVAKCSTALSALRHNDSYVICVYTKDWQDLVDLHATREILIDLGFIQPLKYKRDIDTMNGVYGTYNEFYLEM